MSISEWSVGEMIAAVVGLFRLILLRIGFTTIAVFASTNFFGPKRLFFYTRTLAKSSTCRLGDLSNNTQKKTL